MIQSRTRRWLTGLALMALAPPLAAQEGAGQKWGAIDTPAYRASYVQLGAEGADGLLFEPKGAAASVAVVFTFPRATFDAAPAAELASRGYRVLWVTPYSLDETPYDGLAETSRGIAYLRNLAGVERVVAMSHSGGGRMMAFYAALAEKGPTVCDHPGMIQTCDHGKVTGLARPDGLVLLDSAPGALNTASAVDPAYTGDQRNRATLDMYATANGYDPAKGRATYSPDFLKRFYAAQSARNMALVRDAQALSARIAAGKGQFADDEPFTVHGAVNGGNAASPYHTDLSLLAHSKRPHLLLRADGHDEVSVLHSLRKPTGLQDSKQVNSLCCASLSYTVKHYLDNDAIRTTPDFALTADDIVGIDWRSSLRSTPASAEHITVPTLVLSMTCFHFVVPDEIIYDHLAARDKTYAAVEGALHDFAPCEARYGDTRKRTFDFVAGWLGKPGRF